MASKPQAAGEDMLTCGVCLERYRSPKLLPCFHTFCQRCVEKLAGSKPSLACPACRTVTVIPPGGVRDLQANIDMEKDLAQTESTDQGCHQCTSRVAEYKCVQCQQLYCTTCGPSDKAIPPCSAHTVLPLGAAVEPSKRCQPAKSPQTCPKHAGQALLLFCRRCQVSICVHCKLTSHDGHETEDVMDSSERARQELRGEVDIMAQEEQALTAVLSQVEDFEADLNKERQSAAGLVRARAEQLQNLVFLKRDEALERLEDTAEVALSDLKDQTKQVELVRESVRARRQHYSRVANCQDDGVVLTLMTQLKRTQREPGSQAAAGHSHRDIGIVRTRLRHTCNDSAVQASDVLSYLGAVSQGPSQEVRLDDVNKLSVSEKQPKRTSRLLSKTAKGASEFTYSQNPNAELVDMCLATNDKVWIVYQYTRIHTCMTALFDDRGKKLEQTYASVFTSVRLACDGDTLVSVKDGNFVRPGGISGKVAPLLPGSSATFRLSRPSPQYFVAKKEQQQQKNQAQFGFGKAANNQGFLFGPLMNQGVQTPTEIVRVTNMAAGPRLDTASLCTIPCGSQIDTVITDQPQATFAISTKEDFIAFNVNNKVEVYFLKTGPPQQLKHVASYNVTDSRHAICQLDDLLFCTEGDKERLLVASCGQNTVHVVDHTDGGCFLHTLETDQRPLHRPFRLATNHQGRVWVGCHEGKVVVFDL